MEPEVRSQHPDLANLRLWVQRMSQDYEHVLVNANVNRIDRWRYRREFKAMRRTLDGSPVGSGKACLRRLLASGAVSYGDGIVGAMPREVLPEALMLDFLAHCLWPVIVTPKLPATWFDDLQELTSPPVARLVAQARTSKTTGGIMSFEAFTRILADNLFGFGLLNLLHDLSDPKRGGSAMMAVAIAARTKRPPIGRSKTLLVWLCGATATGVIGNRTDALAVDGWDWLVGNTHSNSGQGGSSDTSHDHDPLGHGSHNAHKSSEGLAQIIHNIFFGH
jgi:hypothetical protein